MPDNENNQKKPSPRKYPVSEIFEKELYSYFLKKYGSEYVYIPLRINAEVWQCTCGAYNRGTRCGRCKRGREEQFALFNPKRLQGEFSAYKAFIAKKNKTRDGKMKAVARLSALLLAGAAVLALVIWLAFRFAVLPIMDNGKINSYMDKGLYEQALKLASEKKDDTYVSELQQRIVDIYIGRDDFKNAAYYAELLEHYNKEVVYSYAAGYFLKNRTNEDALICGLKTSDTALRATLTQMAVTFYADSGEYGKAMEYVDEAAKNGYKVNTAIYSKAAEYFANNKEMEDAVKYAELSQDTTVINNIYALAAAEYAADGDFETAMIYTDKLNDPLLKENIFSNAAAYYTANNEFERAVVFAELSEKKSVVSEVAVSASKYYIGKSDYEKAVVYALKIDDSEVKSKYLASIDDEYIKKNICAAFSGLSFSDKQKINAKLIDIYKDVIAISKSGVAVGNVAYNVSNAVSVAISEFHSVILKADGTVVCFGENDKGQSATGSWSNIAAIAAGAHHTAGLRENGTVVSVGDNSFGQCDTGSLRDVVSICAGLYHTVCLKSDGTVTAVGKNTSGQCDTSEWSDIIAVAAGDYHTVGLKSDGTVVAAGSRLLGKCDVSEWTNVTMIAAGATNTVALAGDGKVLTTGKPVYGNSGAMSAWGNIRIVEAGCVNIAAVQRDGTVICDGDGAVDVSTLGGIASSAFTK